MPAQSLGAAEMQAAPPAIFTSGLEVRSGILAFALLQRARAPVPAVQGQDRIGSSRSYTFPLAYANVAYANLNRWQPMCGTVLYKMNMLKPNAALRLLLLRDWWSHLRKFCTQIRSVGEICLDKLLEGKVQEIVPVGVVAGRNLMQRLID